jgi:peroxiredoxin
MSAALSSARSPAHAPNRASAARVLAAVLVLAFGALCAGLALALPARVPALPPSASWLPSGTKLPEFVLKDDAGREVSSASLVGKPAWLVFFRGVYCPACRAQLADIARHAREAEAVGVQIVALSPDAPEALARLRAELGVTFALWSDEREGAASALCGGVAHCQLLVDAQGTLRWAAVSESWSDVPAPVAILQAIAPLAR